MREVKSRPKVRVRWLKAQEGVWGRGAFQSGDQLLPELLLTLAPSLFAALVTLQG